MKLLDFDYSKQDSFFLERKELMMKRFGLEEKYLSHVLAQSAKPKIDQSTIHAAVAFQFVSKKEIRENIYSNLDKQRKKRKKKRCAEINKQKESALIAREELRSGQPQSVRIKSEKEIWRKRKAFYKSYLKSDTWKDKRLEAIQHYGSLCFGCKADLPYKLIEVHHITYDRIGKEKISDLRIYCKSCHEAEHKRLDSLKKNN
jgi:5-methylcytosine-specific restriction endonuclease McrA